MNLLHGWSDTLLNDAGEQHNHVIYEIFCEGAILDHVILRNLKYVGFGGAYRLQGNLLTIINITKYVKKEKQHQNQWSNF